MASAAAIPKSFVFAWKHENIMSVENFDELFLLFNSPENCHAWDKMARNFDIV